jgi:hypothetical protein
MRAYNFKLTPAMKKLAVTLCDTNRLFIGRFPNTKPGEQCRYEIDQNCILGQLTFTFRDVKFAFHRACFLELMQNIIEGQSAQELQQTFQIAK